MDASARRPRVLVAEDDPVNGELLVRLLRHRGWSAELVPDGLAACDRALGGDWDLVLTDLQMPGADGYAVARRLRAHEAEIATGPWRLPLLAVTANTLPPFLARAGQAGMDGVLEKPIDLARMDAAIGPFAAARPRVLVVHPHADQRRRLGARLAAEGLGPFLAAAPAEVRGVRPFDAAVVARAADATGLPVPPNRVVVRVEPADGPDAADGADGADGDPDDRVAAAVRAALAGAAPTAATPSGPPSSSAPSDRVEVDPEVLDLVPAFLARRRAEAAAVRGFVDAGDWAAVARLARSTTATAGGFGFARLAELGRDLAAAAAAVDRERAERVVAAIAAHLSGVEPVPAPTAGRPPGDP